MLSLNFCQIERREKIFAGWNIANLNAPAPVHDDMDKLWRDLWSDDAAPTGSSSKDPPTGSPSKDGPAVCE